LLFFGQSHTICILEAAKEDPSFSCNWVPFIPDTSGASIAMDSQGYRLNLPTEELLSETPSNNAVVISTCGGNAHNFISLIETGPPFDFLFPEDNSLPAPCNSSAAMIPFELIKTTLYNSLKIGDFTLLEATKRNTPSIKFHLESPPPPKSNELILERLDPFFLSQYPKVKITTPSVRLKMYKLHSLLYKVKCISMGIEFIPTPLSSMDKDGFLKTEFISETSSTHANKAYGQLVIDQLKEKLNEQSI